MRKKGFAWLVLALQLAVVIFISFFTAPIKSAILRSGRDYFFTVNYLNFNPDPSEDGEIPENPDSYSLNFGFSAENFDVDAEMNSDSGQNGYIYINYGYSYTGDNDEVVRYRDGYGLVHVDGDMIQRLQPLFENAYWITSVVANPEGKFHIAGGGGDCEVTVKVRVAGTLIEFEGLYADGIPIEDYFP